MTFSNNFHRLETRLQSQVGRATSDFDMIEDGDTVLMRLSGGKDSYTTLSVLMALQRHMPISFKLIAINLNQRQPGFPEEVLPNYLKKLGVECMIVGTGIYSVVKERVPKGKTTCPLCSRLRHGVIYRTAKKLGANGIALGHHHGGIVSAFSLNMFFDGKIRLMPPKLATDNGDHIVVQPLAYCAEKDTTPCACAMEFPVILYSLCDSQEDLQRKRVKEMLLGWERQTPGRTDNILASLQSVIPSHLADTDLFDFNGPTTGLVEIGEGALFGQTAYDQAPLMFVGSHDSRIEFVRFKCKPGDKSAEQVVPGETAVN